MELKIETRNLEMRKSWQDKIETEKAKLVRHYANYVLHLRVTIENTSNYREGGYEVKLVASVPQDTIVVKRWGEKVMPLLVDAFDVLGLKLKEKLRKMHSHKGAKRGEAILNGEENGVIKRLFPDEAYGFITADDSRDVYFHASALKDVQMSELQEGDAVHFALVEGEQGPEAAWVRPAQ